VFLINLNNATAFSCIAAGTVVLLGVFARGGRGLRRIERTTIAILHVVNGVPARDGQPAVPGVMEHLAEQDHHLAEQDRHLAEQDRELAALRALVNELKPQQPEQ